MLERLHLVRHGEVDNPDHVVYADLPGYPLSTTGRDEARAAGAYLGKGRVDAVVCSPLDRAVETAAIIAAAVDRPYAVDERLTEWRLAGRWAGTVWEELPDVFPGELEAYLEHPHDLRFSPESIAEVAARDPVIGVCTPRPGVVRHRRPKTTTRLRPCSFDHRGGTPRNGATQRRTAPTTGQARDPPVYDDPEEEAA